MTSPSRAFPFPTLLAPFADAAGPIRSAFYMVGDIADARLKAEAQAKEMAESK